jgi:hypothetical protein
MIVTTNDVISASKKIHISLSEIERQLKNNIENKVLSESLQCRIGEIHYELARLLEKMSKTTTAEELLNAGYFDGDAIVSNWIMNLVDLQGEAENHLYSYRSKLKEKNKDKLAVLKYESVLSWIINELEQIMLFKQRVKFEIKPQNHKIYASDSEQFQVACLLNELYRTSIRDSKVPPSKHVEKLLRSDDMRKLVNESGLSINLEDLLSIRSNVTRLVTLINSEKKGRTNT